MANKVTLTNLSNLQNETTAVAAINANNAAITTAMDNTLSRDGSSPNQMNTNLDMNSYQILNLPYPNSPNAPVRLIDLSNATQVILTGGQNITVSGSAPTTIAFSGNLPVTNLDSGTNANVSHFWRGDGAWGVIPAATLTIGVGATSISGGTSGDILFINGSSLDNKGVVGTGAVVLQDTPTLTTPVLGVATATSINKLTITAPATSAVLTIANGKTLTVSNTLTFTGTDSSSVNFGAGGTVVYSGGSATSVSNSDGTLTISPTTGAVVASLALGHANTWTGVQTFTAPVLGTASSTSLAVTGTAGLGFITLLTQSSAPSVAASGFALYADSTGRLSWKRQSDGFTRTWDSALTANRVFTLPDATTTIVGTDNTATFTNKTYDTAGTGNVFKINGTGISAVTGTGSVVLATTPTLVTPVLGVATATSINGLTITSSTGTLTITNAKTLSVSNILTLAGTDSTTITFQGTDTYIGRATTDTLTNKTYDTAGTGNSFKINGTAITAVTGTGSAVLATTPTLVTPVLGVATATTINKVTLTTPASGSTLTILDGKTLTANNTLILAGTDSTTLTFQGTDTYVGRATTDTLTNKTYDTAGTGNVFKISGTTVSTASTILDIIGSTQGNILYKSGTTWAVLAPGTSGQVLSTGGASANPSWATVSGTGTVTSVDMSVPSILAIAGNPVTTAGTLAVTLATQSANLVFAGPTSGGAATPTFRSLVTADYGTNTVTYAAMQQVAANSILGNNTGSTANVAALTASNVLDLVGATQGQVLYRGASGWSALATSTAGRVLSTNGAGADPSWVAVGGTGTVTSITAGTGLTGGAITTSGTIALDIPVAVASGGTASTTAYGAYDTLSVHGADVASASTVNLDTATGNLVDVTGTTTITAITLSEGRDRLVRFTGILTLTNGASLVLPSGANITTAAGDYARFRGYAAGVVRCVSYNKADGTATAGGTVTVPTLQTFNYVALTGTWTRGASQASTYSKTSTTATITKTGHGLTNNDRVYVDFTSGTATDTWAAITFIDANTYSVQTNSGSTSGNATVYPPIVVTATAHGKSNGNSVYVDYNASISDGVATIDNVTANTFQAYYTGATNSSSGANSSGTVTLTQIEPGQTWTRPTGCKWVRVRSQGGGGGGLSAGCTPAGAYAGAYGEKTIDVTGTSSVSVHVGWAGIGLTGVTTGGTASFGASISCTGGSDTSGGTCTGGDISRGSGWPDNTTGTPHGASSPLGVGGTSSVTATGYGAGGAATSGGGSNGSPGVVIVEEYYGS